MALPTRHFKIAFNDLHLSWSMTAKEESRDIVGLFDFAVRGLQFSWDYVLDESPVEQLPNGSWTGVVGLMNRSEVDYVPAALMMTDEGWEAAAYNYPYATDELLFYTKKPEYSPELMALFRTLSPNVWPSLLACIILVTLACFVAMKRICTLGDILLHVLAICLNQEGNLFPRRAGEVLLLSTWLFAMAVFTFCFKSVLLSFLTFPPRDAVRTVPELAAAIRAGQYIAFTHHDNDFATYLQRSPKEDLRVIGESMLENPFYYGRFATMFNYRPQYPKEAFVHRRSMTSFTEGILYASKENMGSFNFATAVSKNFCCKAEMDMLVHRFLAAGIHNKIQRFENHRRTSSIHTYIEFFKPPDDDENITRKLTMTDLSGAFILLVAGQCLSVFVLIIECCLKRTVRRRSSTRTT